MSASLLIVAAEAEDRFSALLGDRRGVEHRIELSPADLSVLDELLHGHPQTPRTVGDRLRVDTLIWSDVTDRAEVSSSMRHHAMASGTIWVLRHAGSPVAYRWREKRGRTIVEHLLPTLASDDRTLDRVYGALAARMPADGTLDRYVCDAGQADPSDLAAISEVLPA